MPFRTLVTISIMDMDIKLPSSRRLWVKSSVFGLLGISTQHLVWFQRNDHDEPLPSTNPTADLRYPAINLDIAEEVVNVSHFNLERLKELVDSRPELSKASWDWGFGDWESALGAASHVGRRDIATYLMQQGATPAIFTFAMFGAYGAVKAMIDASPGIQRTTGPHGISLLQHARLALEIADTDRDQAQRLVDYLEALGDANGPKYLPVSEAEKEKFLGDYRYGDGLSDGFSVRLNMKKSLSLGKLGNVGGALFKIDDNQFTYSGAPSIRVSFAIANNRVQSLTINEPDFRIEAVKIN